MEEGAASALFDSIRADLQTRKILTMLCLACCEEYDFEIMRFAGPGAAGGSVIVTNHQSECPSCRSVAFVPDYDWSAQQRPSIHTVPRSWWARPLRAAGPIATVKNQTPTVLPGIFTKMHELLKPVVVRHAKSAVSKHLSKLISGAIGAALWHGFPSKPTQDEVNRVLLEHNAHIASKDPTARHYEERIRGMLKALEVPQRSPRPPMPPSRRVFAVSPRSLRPAPGKALTSMFAVHVDLESAFHEGEFVVMEELERWLDWIGPPRLRVGSKTEGATLVHDESTGKRVGQIVQVAT